MVAVLAAYAQAVFAAQAAAAGAMATPRPVYLLGAAATLIGAVAINVATRTARSRATGDVPETAKAARSGVHQTTLAQTTMTDE